MVKKHSIDTINLDGGTLCLDFVNTVHDRKKEPVPDYLLHTDDLIRWGKRMELLPGNTPTLTATGRKRNALKEAIIFRESLYRIFLTLGKDGIISPEDLKTFNRYLSHYLPHLRIVKGKNGFNRKWELPEGEVSRIIGPVLLDAYDLILSDKLHRVKECPNCGWLFLDTTKNGRRRWCSMKSCGSSVKALEWYHRQKG